MQGLNRIGLAGIVIAGLIVGHAQEALATCKTSGDSTKQVCVEWSEPGPAPVLNTDFRVDYDCTGCSDAPLVQFRAGSDSWVVYSEVISTSAPANIGELAIDPSSSTEIFEITIDNGGSPGAANLSSAVLTAASWTGYSSIIGGSISGNLTGNIEVVDDSGGSGGELRLVIEGNQSGNITADTLLRLKVQGDSSGDITIETVADSASGFEGIEITGDVSGTIDIEDYEVSENFIIDGDISGTVDIETWNPPAPGWKFFQRRAITSTGSLRFGTLTNSIEIALNDLAGVYDFAGSLTIEDDLDVFQAVFIHGEVTSGAFVDLKNNDVGGTLAILSGGAGELRNVGQVLSGGVVVLAEFSGTSFDGRATIASVAAGGKVAAREGTSVGGRVTVNGSVAGIIDITGSLNYPGLISVAGSLQVGADIDVRNDCNGDIDIAQDCDGSINIGDKLDRRGRILIDGMLDGPISIGESTVSSSQIVILDGIDDNGSITINDIDGAFSANGDISIGVAGIPLPDVTFGGSILIKDDGTIASGNLVGDIDITGCHPEDHGYLDICIEGGVIGSVNITQGACSYPVCGYQCGGGACP